MNQSGGLGFNNPLKPGVSTSFYKASVTAEAAGQFHSHYLTAGNPGAGTAPAMGLNGATVTRTTAGALPLVNAASGVKYLYSFVAFGGATGVIIPYDRLWHNSGIVVTTTTAQTITFSGLPARDQNGTSNGLGVELWLEVYTATTNAGVVTTITASYTNQDGTSGRTATIPGFPATAVAGTSVPFLLQAGDTGVRSVESITLGTTLGGGSVGLVCLRRLAGMPILLANVGGTSDFRSATIPLYTDTALFFMQLVTGTTSGSLAGTLYFTEY